MSKYNDARLVLIKSRDEILRELAVCGQAGGTGRAAAYAPQLVSIQGAIEALDRIEGNDVPKVDRMAAVRAAKTAQ
jgi:hypothetical protein